VAKSCCSREMYFIGAYRGKSDVVAVWLAASPHTRLRLSVRLPLPGGNLNVSAPNVQ